MHTSSDSDSSVDRCTLQLVYGVASASETATGALSSSVSLSPHHLPTLATEPLATLQERERDGGGCFGAPLPLSYNGGGYGTEHL